MGKQKSNVSRTKSLVSRTKSGVTSGKDDSEDESNSEESEEEDEESVAKTSNDNDNRHDRQKPANKAYSGAALGLQSDEEDSRNPVTRSHTYMGAIKPVEAKVQQVNYASSPNFAGYSQAYRSNTVVGGSNILMGMDTKLMERDAAEQRNIDMRELADLLA